jgi:hypothetical protein
MKTARRKDAYFRLGTGRRIPPIIPFHDLKKSIGYLHGGNILIMAVDVGIGKQVLAKNSLGVLQMASGAIRIARSTGAHLIPCLLYEEEPWRFVVKMGGGIFSGRNDNSSTQSTANELARAFQPMLLDCVEQYECGPLTFWSRLEETNVKSSGSRRYRL